MLGDRKAMAPRTRTGRRLVTGLLAFLVALGFLASAEAQQTRSFKIASVPMQIDPDSPIGFGFEFDFMAGDLDMVSILQDFFGIPWIELRSGAPLPPAWLAFQQDIKARTAATGLPVYLQLTPLSSDDRNRLSPYVVEAGGNFNLVPNWSAACFDFVTDPLAAAVRSAYLDYVDLMIELFEPTHVTTFIELNIYLLSGCTEGWDGLVGFANQVYDHVKSRWPDLIVFPSHLIDGYWFTAAQDCPGDPTPCLEAGVAPLLPLAMDRFGISTYPMTLLAVGADIPRGLITGLAAVVGKPLAIAETGFNSTDIVISGAPLIGSCKTVMKSSDANQATYMELLFRDADGLDIDLVTWWSFRDFLPRAVGGACPCPLSELEICVLLSLVKPFDQALFRSFGNMGVLYNDGGEKPIHALWQSWRARPIRP